MEHLKLINASMDDGELAAFSVGPIQPGVSLVFTDKLIYHTDPDGIPDSSGEDGFAFQSDEAISLDVDQSSSLEAEAEKYDELGVLYFTILDDNVASAHLPKL